MNVWAIIGFVILLLVLTGLFTGALLQHGANNNEEEEDDESPNDGGSSVR